MGGTWIGVWIFVIGYLGVDFCFIIFCGVGGWGLLALEFLGGQILFIYLFLNFFYFLSKYFFIFFSIFLLFFFCFVVELY